MQAQRKTFLIVAVLVVSDSLGVPASVDSASQTPHSDNDGSLGGSRPHHSQVLIIGAGATGVAAAARLMENGVFNVTILEAEDRVGGRTHSVKFGNDVVDLGAQWVAGSQGNVVYEMANPLGLLEEGMPLAIANMRYLQANGTVPDENLLGRLLNLSLSIADDKEAMLNYSGPFGQYFLDKFAEQTSNPANNLNGNPSLVSSFIPWVENLFAFSEGADSWWNVSAKGLNQSWDCEGTQGINWINNGYSSVIDLLTCLPLIGFGQVDKLFLHFNETWWPMNIAGFTIIPTDEDKMRFNQLYPQFSEKGEWATSLTGFYLLPRQPRSVLFDWLVGEPDRNMEKYSDDDVMSACVRWLEIFVGRKLPLPLTFARSKWYSNPHFRGSYTYPSLDSQTYDAQRAHLAEPLMGHLGNPEVLFAGEATNDHHFGHVHGAIETGWREADRILYLFSHEKR